MHTILILTSYFPALALLISSSKLTSCYDSGQNSTMSCDRKIVVSLSVENDQLKGTESIEAILDNVESPSGNSWSILQPLKIQVSKSKVFARYPLRYLQDFNNQPKELVIPKQILGCEDDSYADSPSCGWRYDSSGQRIWDSQGYCCRCSFEEIIGINDDQLNRGNDCKKFNLGEGASTAHCIEWDKLWYSAYQIGTHVSYYNLDVFILRPLQGNYTKDGLRLSPSNPVQSTDSKDIIARLIGDFYPNQPPPALSSYYLLTPSRPITHIRVQEGSRSWMFLSPSEITFDGTECNKIGTSYSAFRYQPNKCDQPVQSCFQNQLEHKHQEDLKRLEKGQAPLHLIGGYGNYTVLTSNFNIFLQVEIQGRFSTMITIEIAADDIRFITNLGKAEIDYAVVEGFEALSYDGDLICQVTNVGDIVSSFFLNANCSSGIAPIPSISFSLKPLESTTMSSKIHSEYELSKEYWCNITVTDTIGQVLDYEMVYFNTSSRHTDEGTQGGTGDVKGEYITEDKLAEESCESICEDWYDLGCFFVEGCWDSILMFFGIFLGIICIVILLKIIVRRYGICCQKVMKMERQEEYRRG
jgi:hypothetical protein